MSRSFRDDRPPPAPPRPDLVRKPPGAFGWLDARLLHEGWLAQLGPDATAALVLLAIAADHRGASFYGRARMSSRLGLARPAIDRALDRLLATGLLLHRPWRAGDPDGVWQLLPLPPAPSDIVSPAPRGSGPVAVSELLSRLGIQRPP